MLQAVSADIKHNIALTGLPNKPAGRLLDDFDLVGPGRYVWYRNIRLHMGAA